MKTKNLFQIGAAFFVSLCLLNSCKKSPLTSNASQNELKAAVQNWSAEFTKTASENGRLSATDIVNSLNYEDGAIVEQPGSRTILLIRKGVSGNRNEYFALLQTQGQIQAMGVYEAKDLKQIQDFLQTKKLPVGEKLTMNSLFGKPVVQWETSMSGKPILRMAQSRKMIDRIINKNKVSQASIKTKLNYVPEPEPGCTDWYWVEYDPSSGMIYSIDYLYSTCTGGGGGGGAIPNEEISCQQQGEDEINYDTYETAEMLYITGSETSATTRSRAYHWKIYGGLTWHIKSHEVGEHEYSNTENKWNWVSLTHSSTSFVGFWAGGTITCTLNTAVPSVYPQYAGMDLNYNIKFEWTCSGKPCVRVKDANSGMVIHVDQITP
jgi:hypothetical protein